MDKSICTYNIGMRKLLEAINEEPAGIAFIEDESKKLCGVVTDGDFRRMLLSGKSLDVSLSKDDLGDFVYARQGEDIDELLKKISRKVRFIPIVDKNNRLADYFRYEHRVHMMPVAQPNLQGNEFKYLSDAFLSTWISSSGSYIDRFEQGFSAYCETDHGVATSNGSVALLLALKALGIGEGDEVIVPDLTFAASINAVIHANATPVIVDIEGQSWCIDPVEVEKAITPRTKAIMPVHVYGQPCDMEAIMDIAKRHGLFVVEDAAEAHGAEYNGQKVGSFGDIGCFSFYGNKIITTGEGGMCVTSSPELDEKMRVLRDHGMNKTKRYWHDVIGYNFRMTNLQAAIGCAQLERIDDFLKERMALEQQYRVHLNDMGIFEWPRDLENRKRVVWLISALVKNMARDELISAVKKNGIDARPFFYPLSGMPVYQQYVFSSRVSKQVSAAGVNLPTVGSEVEFSRFTSVLSVKDS